MGNVRQGITLVSASYAQRPAAMKKKRDIRSEPARDCVQAARGDSPSRQAEQPNQRRSSVAGAAAKSPPRGDALGECRADPMPPAKFPAEFRDGPVNQVLAKRFSGK